MYVFLVAFPLLVVSSPLFIPTDIITLSAFNDVATHDVEWGEPGVPHLETESVDYWKGSYVRSLLPLGKLLSCNPQHGRVYVY